MGTESDRGWSSSAGLSTVSSDEYEQTLLTATDDGSTDYAEDSGIEDSACYEWDAVGNNHDANQSNMYNESGQNYSFREHDNVSQDPESWLHEQANKTQEELRQSQQLNQESWLHEQAYKTQEEQQQSQQFDQSKSTFPDYDADVFQQFQQPSKSTFPDTGNLHKSDQSKNAFVDSEIYNSKNTFAAYDVGIIEASKSDDETNSDYETGSGDQGTRSDEDESLAHLVIPPRNDADDEDGAVSSISDNFMETDSEFHESDEDLGDDSYSDGSDSNYSESDLDDIGKRTESPQWAEKTGGQYHDGARDTQASRFGASEIPSFISQNPEKDLGMPDSHPVAPAYREAAVFSADFPEEAHNGAHANNDQNKPPPAYQEPPAFGGEFPDGFQDGSHDGSHDGSQDGSQDGSHENKSQNREEDYEDEYEYDDDEGDEVSMVWLFCFLCCVVFVIAGIGGLVFGIVRLTKGDDEPTPGSTENSFTFNTNLPTFELTYTYNSTGIPTPSRIQYDDLLQETIDFYKEEFTTSNSRRLSSLHDRSNLLRRFLQTYTFLDLKLTRLGNTELSDSIIVEYSGRVEYQTQESVELSPDFLFETIEDADYNNYVNNYLRKLPSSPFANVASVEVDQATELDALSITPTLALSMEPTMSAKSITSSSLAPSIEPTSEIYKLIVQASFDDGASLQVPDSPQSRAFEWLLTDTLDVPDERKIQRYALATFYYATEGEQWVISDWLDTATSECTWHTDSVDGSCNDEDMMIALVFVDENVGGELPPELGMLPNLRTLIIQNAQDSGVTGGIPTELSALSFMETFELKGHNFIDQLPNDLFAAWPSLDRIALVSCQIPGAIPDSVTNLTNLQYLSLAQNELVGTIPPGVPGDLVALTHLDLSKNSLTGPIPEMLEMMVNLKAILLAENRLTGPIPNLNNLTELELFHIEDNMITGSLTAGTCQALENNGATAYADCEEVSCSCCTHCCEQDGGSSNIFCSPL